MKVPSIVEGKVLGRVSRLVDLSPADYQGGFIEVQGAVHPYSVRGDVIRFNMQRVGWDEDGLIFGILCSHLLKYRESDRKWVCGDRAPKGIHYPEALRDFVYGPFVHENGSVSFFVFNEHHFVTIFPRKTYLPPMPIDAGVKKYLWDLLAG